MPAFSPAIALDAALQAAATVAAGALARQQAGTASAAVDRECQEQLLGMLLAAFPGEAIAVCAEERTPTVAQFATIDAASSVSSSLWRWIVDPIDGSGNYVGKATAGDPTKPARWSVTVALQQPDGDLAGGLIVFPALDETWIAHCDGTISCNGQPVVRPTIDANAPVGLHSRARSLTRGATLGRPIRMPGCASWALTRVLTGELAAYICNGTWLWDIAAGHCLLRALGGTLMQADGSEPAWSPTTTRVEGLLVASADTAIADALRSAVAAVTT
ncbi:MAG: inositol monophosphatase [Planctomycetota bacterium]